MSDKPKAIDMAFAQPGSAATPRSHPQYEFLQILRFVAAALVLLAHGTYYFKERIDPAMPLWHTEVGVSIFFVLSGVVMVVSSQSLPRNAAGASVFMGRRLLRVVPLYWLVTLAKIAISLAVPVVVLHNHFEIVPAIKSFLFIPYFNSEDQIRPLHGVGWTLLHEMFFYLLFAATLLLRLNPARYASLTILALYALGIAFDPESAPLIVATSAINLNFVLGMLIGSAMLVRRRRWTRVSIPVLLACAAIAQWGEVPPALMPFDPLVLLVGAAIVAVGTKAMPAALKLPSRLGDSSYALYLFHPILTPPILLLLHHLKVLGNLPIILMAVLLVIGIAHAIHLFVEVPLNRWVKRVARRSEPRDPLMVEATKP